MENDIRILEQDNGEGEELISQLDDELKKPLLTEIARKKHFREKFEKEKEARVKLEEELKNLRESANKAKDTPPANNQGDEIEAILRLKVEGYSDDEALKLRSYAKKMGVSLDEVAKDPVIKAGLDAERAKIRVAQNTPNPSGRTSTIIDNKPWQELTADERSKNVGKAFEEAVRGRSKSNE